jgi:anti-sigma regulatory factor (Ser/Thr protein kinase)
VSVALRVELTLPGVPASVPAARRFVRDTLATWGLDLLVDAAALVVSELATNAVLHARSELTVRLLKDEGGSLRLEVLDRSPRQVAPRHHSAGSATGRGLSIVRDLASDWGVDERAGGKTVWVQLAAVAFSEQPFAGDGDPLGGHAGQRRSEPQGTAGRAA